MRGCVMGMVLGMAWTLIPLSAFAIVRCDDQGMISYSDAPCASGQQSTLLTPPSSADPDQAEQARRKLERQQQQLQRLQSTRERNAAAEESARARAEAGRQAHAKRCKLLELKARWSADDAAQASLKQQAHARKSAQRKNEQYQLECGTNR